MPGVNVVQCLASTSCLAVKPTQPHCLTTLPAAQAPLPYRVVVRIKGRGKGHKYPLEEGAVFHCQYVDLKCLQVEVVLFIYIGICMPPFSAF